MKEFKRPKDWHPPFTSEDTRVLTKLVEGAESVFEIGPGDSTALLLELGKKVTTCEHDPHWFEVAKERFGKEARVLKYENEMPVPPIEGLDDKERFDVGFVDGPQGYFPVRVVFKGYEDCSRLNTCLYALQRCKVVYLHDAVRSIERGSLGRLSAMGFQIDFVGNPFARIMHPEGTEWLPEQTSSTEPSATSAPSRKDRARLMKTISQLVT